MKIGIGAAVYITNTAHAKMARETLESMTSKKHKLDICLWLNHSVTDEDLAMLESFGHVHDNGENNVSRAWNRAINCLLKRRNRYVLVPNMDIIVKEGSLDALVAHARANPEPILWTMAPWFFREDAGDAPGIARAPLHDHTLPYPHFSCFLVDKRLFDRVGPFDENFRPAYNEDLDMHWRIQLAGETAVQWEGARFYHYGSGTIRTDGELAELNSHSHARLNEYFVSKWGYKPPTADDAFTADMFKVPFNDPARVGFERDFTKSW